MIKLSVFKKKKCSYLYNNFVTDKVPEILFPSLHDGKNCKVFLCSPTPHFAQVFSSMQHFPIIDQCRFFFTSGIGPNILMKVLEDYIIILI